MKCPDCGINTAQPASMHECTPIILDKQAIVSILIDTITIQSLDEMKPGEKYLALTDLNLDPNNVDIRELKLLQNCRARFALDQAKQLGLLPENLI